MSEPLPRNTATLALGAALAAILFVACGPGATASPSSAAAAPIESSADGSAASTGIPQAGQTDTDWGRVWDSLPAAFPVYPGATPADDAATEVVSATFALEGADPRTVSAWMQTELEHAMYATEALNGPLEDGSFVLESTGTADCRIQVAVAPLGGLTTINVRYGAACQGP